jgi:hypothetical protein
LILAAAKAQKPKKKKFSDFAPADGDAADDEEEAQMWESEHSCLDLPNLLFQPGTGTKWFHLCVSTTCCVKVLSSTILNS